MNDFIHTSEEGKSIPIPMLEDSHLVNIIKKPFKKYNMLLPKGDLFKYLVGSCERQLEMTPEMFSEAMLKFHPYWIEALRRNSTRNEVLDFLGSMNPVFPQAGNMFK